MIHENMILGHLEGRAPRARGGGKPARPNGSRPQKKKKPTKKKSPVKKKSSVKKKTSTRKKTSARKKSPIKKKTTTRKKSPTQKKTTTRRKKNAKSRPSRKTPTSKKPTQTRPARPPITKRPTSAKHTSSSRIKSRPFTLAPQPTKAVNSCLISGIDCFVNLKARREVDTKFNARYEESHSLEKRGRDFAAIALKSGDLQVYDKGYHESGPLENGKAGKKWEEAWVDFQNNDIKDVDVKLYPKRPTQLQINGEPRLYRAEHIVEVR
jgi:cell wall-associated NlpC family hydrolase